MSKRAPIAAQEYTTIQNLYAYYSLCSDAGDADGFSDCFTQTGELSIPAVQMLIKGREQLHAFKLKDKAQRGNRYRRHWNSGLYLERVDNGQIRGRCYLQAYNGEPGHLPVLADVGVYDDLIEIEDGEWRFAKRVITMDASTFTPPDP